MVMPMSEVRVRVGAALYTFLAADFFGRETLARPCRVLAEELPIKPICRLMPMGLMLSQGLSLLNSDPMPGWEFSSKFMMLSKGTSSDHSVLRSAMPARHRGLAQWPKSRV